MKLPDIVGMEPFQQYLAEKFPKDGKRSTRGVVRECQCLLKDPHGAWYVRDSHT